jgi:hypothetical protein
MKASDLDELLLPRAEELLGVWMPDGSMVGEEFVACNPTRADSNPGSFKFNAATGKWADFATGEAGHGLVSLRAYIAHEGSGAKALRELKRLVLDEGFKSRPTPKKATRKKRGKPPAEPIAPVTKEGKSVVSQVLDTTTPSFGVEPPEWTLDADPVVASWAYTDESGNLLFWRVRAETPNGKVVQPVRWVEAKGDYSWTQPPGRPPLWQRHKLVPGVEMILAEGEKTAEHLQRLYPDKVATTAPGGAGNLFKCDVQPLVTAKAVTVFPDADQAGTAYALEAVLFCRLNNVPVQLADVAALEWEDGQDAADFPSLGPGDYARVMMDFDAFAKKLTRAELADAFVKVLAQLTSLDYSAARKDAAKLLGIQVSVLDDEVQKARPRDREEEVEPPRPEEELLEECRVIAENPMAALDAAMEEAGVVGERATTRFAYLVATSAHFAKPASGVVRGLSGGGKSTAVGAAVQLFPESYVRVKSSFSPKSVVYDAEGSFRNTTIFLMEGEALVRTADEDKNAVAEMLRVLLSEGYLIHSTVEKDPDTGKFTTVTYSQEGPTNLLVTTTREHFDWELENRLISLHVEEKREHANRVITAVGKRAAGEAPKVSNLSAWHSFAEWVRCGPTTVIVPFGGRVAETMLTGETRTARDLSNLLALTRASALVNRLGRTVDDAGRLIAQPADYRVAYEILGAAINVKLGGVPADVVEVFQAVKGVIETMGKRCPVRKVKTLTVTMRELSEQIGMPKTVMYRRLNAAVTLELIGRDEQRVRSQPTTIWVGPHAETILAGGGKLLHPDTLERGEA